MRRRQRRRRILFGSFFLGLLLVGALIYLLNQPLLRISHIGQAGSLAPLEQIAQSAMQGSYLGLIPRDSTLFYPGSHIRAEILAAYPSIAAVSIAHDGLTGLSIRVDDRVPIASWCGAAPTARDLATSSASTSDESCTFFDAEGVLYATTTLDAPINTFRFYEPVASGVTTLKAPLPNASTFPAAFDFARRLATFGSPVTAVVYRDGEVDDYLLSGTRVTYVLGNEENAFTALTSAKGDLNLGDGSLEYVDLRFDGKVYLKPKDAKVK